MMIPEWESYATQLTNAGDLDAETANIIKETNISSESYGLVVLGRDTRPSSEYLSFAATEGVLRAKGRAINLGIATTPQLHFLTCQLNMGVPIERISMNLYYSYFSDAFLAITKVGFFVLSKLWNYSLTYRENWAQLPWTVPMEWGLFLRIVFKVGLPIVCS